MVNSQIQKVFTRVSLRQFGDSAVFDRRVLKANELHNLQKRKEASCWLLMVSSHPLLLFFHGCDLQYGATGSDKHTLATIAAH